MILVLKQGTNREAIDTLCDWLTTKYNVKTKNYHSRILRLTSRSFMLSRLS